MKFFFDRCMSIKLCRMAAILDAGRHHVIHHDDDPRFSPTTTDIEWITTLARDSDRPVVVSGDYRILRKPDEVAALKQSSLTFFCLTDHWPRLSLHEMAWKFVKVWPEIVGTAATRDPTVFEVSAGKSLKAFLPGCR